MKKKLLLALSIMLAATVFSQDKSLYEKQWFIQNGDTLPFRLLLPKNYDPLKSYPLIFFLHGRGESGKDNEKQLANGATLFLKDSIRNKYPAIVVFPQCRATGYWSNVNTIAKGTSTSKRTFYFVEDGPPSTDMQLLMSLVDNIFVRYSVNKHQVYVGGLSMGGMGTYELVRRKPKTFAAAFAICGGAHPATAKQIQQTDWWLFHGLKDDVVDPTFTQKMEAALRNNHAKVKVTYYPDANHNSWDSAFAEPDLVPWLFSKKR
jgi:predicted peptidase